MHIPLLVFVGIHRRTKPLDLFEVTLRKQLALALVALLVAVLVPLFVTSNASAQTPVVEEQQFIDALNNTRAELGLPRLTFHQELTDLSRVHAIDMAAEDNIFHANPISANLDAPWLKLGENVGVGPQVDVLMDKFIESPSHYENIIDPAFTHVGVAVVWDGDLMFTTHRFMQLADQQLSTPTTTPPVTAGTELTSTTPAAIDAGLDGRLVPPPATRERIDALVDSLAD